MARPSPVAWGRRRGQLDEPGSRRWHEDAIPRTGGLARFLGVVLGYVFLLVAGYIDDRLEPGRPNSPWRVTATS